MLKRSQPALQVQTANGWDYVFCRNARSHGGVVTTDNRAKALPGDSIDYFRDKCANRVFRAQTFSRALALAN